MHFQLVVAFIRRLMAIWFAYWIVPIGWIVLSGRWITLIGKTKPSHLFVNLVGVSSRRKFLKK